MGLVNINVMGFINQCYSNSDGQVILDLIKKEFSKGNKVAVSFEGVTAVNSSFVNTAFIELLDSYDFNFVKTHLQFKNTTKQINSMIKGRFEFEVKKSRQLVTNWYKDPIFYEMGSLF